ncbi:hypothetical protein [Prosthecobacter sp.]|uniref:hypothetical protein n=1 Tax=Prosthecobacter sp. TaxID=1965333 RepID=UPI002489AB2F|nr:hypothetical protein [Prosthecobacter sp.]MDI1312289.1 hypothetical protein [Prosthecobacter sp.]
MISVSSHTKAASPLTVIDDDLAQARTKTKQVIDQTLAYSHDHPEEALVYALATGYVLRTLPVTRLLGGIVRVALPLLKPAALFYGISKVVLKKRN